MNLTLLRFPDLIKHLIKIFSYVVLTSGSASFDQSGETKNKMPSEAPGSVTPRTTNTVNITYGNVAVKYAT